jgi:phage gpG-like protein
MSRLRLDADVSLVVQRLKDVGRDLSDNQPAFEAAADEIREELDERFARGIRPATGREWARRKGNKPTLVYTGTLRRSLTVKGAKYSKQVHLRDGILVKTTDPVARIHKKGAGGLKKRNPAMLTKAAKGEVVAVFRDRLLRSLR